MNENIENTVLCTQTSLFQYAKQSFTEVSCFSFLIIFIEICKNPRSANNNNVNDTGSTDERALAITTETQYHSVWLIYFLETREAQPRVYIRLFWSYLNEATSRVSFIANGWNTSPEVQPRFHISLAAPPFRLPSFFIHATFVKFLFFPLFLVPTFPSLNVYPPLSPSFFPHSFPFSHPCSRFVRFTFSFVFFSPLLPRLPPSTLYSYFAYNISAS